MHEPSDPPSLPEASPAKMFQAPATDRGSAEAAPGSGLSTFGSFAYYDHQSLSWKTCQGSLFEASMKFSGDWPQNGTMRSGACTARVTSALPTSDAGSSLSPHKAPYPTPSATAYGSSGNGTGNNTTSRGRPSLQSMGKSWPTAAASDHKGSTVPGQRRGQLSEAILTWPTPLARDGKGARSEKSIEGNPGRSLPNLAATTWPTATAGDAKASGSRGKRGFEGNEANEGTSLTDATCRSGRPLLTTCTHGGECLPRLNPRFVSWLMGFPLDWIGSWAVRVAKRSKRSATP
jgi:hypothetical protein